MEVGTSAYILELMAIDPVAILSDDVRARQQDWEGELTQVSAVR